MRRKVTGNLGDAFDGTSKTLFALECGHTAKGYMRMDPHDCAPVEPKTVNCLECDLNRLAGPTEDNGNGL